MEPTRSPAQTESMTRQPAFSLDGGNHTLPWNYELPITNVNVRTALRLWNVGIPANRIPPLKNVQAKDFKGDDLAILRRSKKG